mmetsp:Transcript_10590/g.16230  ORF Transcript_10590/g.16230 Transcript_10590/m.16230 type:complete len:196 (+) Transcript_10590:95-682(+)
MEMHGEGKAPVRDLDELEGTLLLPKATEVKNEAAAAAVPFAQFEYETAKADPVTELADQHIPQAPIVPSYDSLDSRLRAESSKIVIAKRTGLQKSEDEKEKLRNVQNNVYATNYHAAKSVEEANKKCKERDMAGVEIKKDNWFGKEKQYDEKSLETHDISSKSHNTGYECAAYKISEYTGNGDYEISEYKSVYDS